MNNERSEDRNSPAKGRPPFVAKLRSLLVIPTEDEHNLCSSEDVFSDRKRHHFNGKPIYFNWITLFLCLIFAFIFYSYTVKMWNEYGYILNFIYNFDMGIISRGIFGELFRLFFPELTVHNVVVACRIMALILNGVIMIFFISFLLQNNYPAQIRLGMLCIVFFVVQNFYGNYFGLLYGMPDVPNLACFVLCFLFVKSPKMSFFIVPLCLLGIAFHFCFSVYAFPSILLIQFFEIFHDKCHQKTRVAAFAVNAVAGTAVAVYFVAYAKYFENFGSVESFMQYINSYTSELYSGAINEDNIINLKLAAYEFYSTMKSGFYDSVGLISTYISNLVPDIQIMLDSLKTGIPLLLFFSAFWIYLLVKSKEIYRKLIYAGFICSPFVVVILFFVTSDFGRWINWVLTVDFLSLLYFMSRPDEPAQKYILCNNKVFAVFMVCMALFAVNSFVVGVYI